MKQILFYIMFMQNIVNLSLKFTCVNVHEYISKSRIIWGDSVVLSFILIDCIALNCIILFAKNLPDFSQWL